MFSGKFGGNQPSEERTKAKNINKMGGEMNFLHHDKPIEDLQAYKKILEEMKNDCATKTTKQRPDIPTPVGDTYAHAHASSGHDPASKFNSIDQSMLYGIKPISRAEKRRQNSLRKKKIDAAACGAGLQVRLIANPISRWNNGYIAKWEKKAIIDDDYELSIDLGWSTRSPENHENVKHYVLFPKDPNALKILSYTDARGMYWDNRVWIHNYFVKFVTTFPGVFELYYGDGFDGFGESEIIYRDGSAVPIQYDTE